MQTLQMYESGGLKALHGGGLMLPGASGRGGSPFPRLSPQDNRNWGAFRKRAIFWGLDGVTHSVKPLDTITLGAGG